jgi:hypothetical protein
VVQIGGLRSGARSNGILQKFWQADEIEGCGGEGERPSEAVGAPQHRPPHSADGLHPQFCTGKTATWSSSTSTARREACTFGQNLS